VFPRVFSGPHGISRAAVLQTVLALFLVYQASILELLNYVGVTLSLFSAFAVSTLWLPRTAASAEPHPRMPPLVAAAAVLYVTATLLFVVLMTRHEPRHIYGTLATIVIGVAAWPLVGRGRRAAC
jgi:hypothetical protein